MKFKDIKNEVIEKITTDLKKDKRAIVRGLGTFKIVKYKAKKTPFGSVKARTNIRFKPEVQLRKKFSTMR
jgi:nucleoid DNA-binding protein